MLRLDAGGAFAGRTYWVLGSFSGSAPGLPIGGEHLPLNYDLYTSFLLTYPNTVIPGSLGALDGEGRAETVLAVPPGAPPALLGATIHHAYLVFSGPPSAATAILASNAAALTFES